MVLISNLAELNAEYTQRVAGERADPSNIELARHALLPIWTTSIPSRQGLTESTLTVPLETQIWYIQSFQKLTGNQSLAPTRVRLTDTLNLGDFADSTAFTEAQRASCRRHNPRNVTWLNTYAGGGHAIDEGTMQNHDRKDHIDAMTTAPSATSQLIATVAGQESSRRESDPEAPYLQIPELYGASARPSDARITMGVIALLDYGTDGKPSQTFVTLQKLVHDANVPIFADRAGFLWSRLDFELERAAAIIDGSTYSPRKHIFSQDFGLVAGCLALATKATEARMPTIDEISVVLHDAVREQIGMAALLLGETLSEDLVERCAVDKTGKLIHKSTFDILAELV